MFSVTSLFHSSWVKNGNVQVVLHDREPVRARLLELRGVAVWRQDHARDLHGLVDGLALLVDDQGRAARRLDERARLDLRGERLQVGIGQQVLVVFAHGQHDAARVRDGGGLARQPRLVVAGGFLADDAGRHHLVLEQVGIRLHPGDVLRRVDRGWPSLSNRRPPKAHMNWRQLPPQSASVIWPSKA